MTSERNMIDPKFQWDLNQFYQDKAAFEKDFHLYKGKETAPFWPELTNFKGRLKESPEAFLEALKIYFELSRRLEKLATFAHLKHDEDIVQNENKKIYESCLIVLQKFQEETSWFEPEIFTLSDETFSNYLSSKLLSEFHFYLEKLNNLREHILSEKEEILFSLAQKALQSPSKAFSSLNNADFKFDPVKDQHSKENPLTHGLYQVYMQSRDRILRENAFVTLHKKYSDYENTLCNLIYGEILSHQFTAKARKYNSCLESALKPNQIPVHVYSSLITAVKEEIDALHEYYRLRKKCLKLDELHLFDMNVPLTSELNMHMDYKQATEAVIESVGILGKEYQEILQKGLKEQGWVDVYENKNKRSGAYSSGCFDSLPYILLNYKGLMRDVFTLAHECGHSMHSYYSHKNQPYHYSHYSIFVAEVASTFNEELLSNYLLERAKTKEEKIFLINSKIEDIRSTLFRQTLFAEFELLLHTFVENDIPLTPDLLKEEYRKLNLFYFGNEVHIDPSINIEWARIPHFYYNFYVYQYATGISAALSLAQQVMENPKTSKERYLSFLKGGSSDYPISLLKNAGVDMQTTQPVKDTIKKFRNLTKQLESLAVL